jgi:hypothetical protein
MPARSCSARSLLVGERGPLEGIVLLADDQVPAQGGELAGGGHHGDLHAAAGADAFVEGTQRPGGLGRGPGGLHQHAAGMGAALGGDPAVLGWLAGVAHPRVETQIADQPLRGGEPTKVPDRGHDRQGHGGIHARDGQQPADLGAFQADPAEFGVDDPQLLAVEVELAQQPPRPPGARLGGGPGWPARPGPWCRTDPRPGRDR